MIVDYVAAVDRRRAPRRAATPRMPAGCPLAELGRYDTTDGLAAMIQRAVSLRQPSPDDAKSPRRRTRPMKLALETRSPMDARADVLVLGRYAAPTRPAPELRRARPDARRPPLAPCSGPRSSRARRARSRTSTPAAAIPAGAGAGRGPRPAKRGDGRDRCAGAAAAAARGARATSAPRASPCSCPPTACPRARGPRRSSRARCSAPIASTST